MACPQCQQDNPADARFCNGCGSRLLLTCPSCNQPNPPSSRFCNGCGQKLGETAPPAPVPRFAEPQGYTPKHLAEKILSSRSALEGERKLVTVLFADVSGFTSLSERLDPENVHGLMARVFELILAEVHRYEGTVNQFLGDGVMALFGAPIAHEDHARRGVQAALGISKALGAYGEELRRAQGITFRVRQGLNTGLVVVGSIGNDLRMDYTAVGDTTNVAARMQQAAEPGHVLISEATHRLVSGYFEARDVGELSLKGKAAPVHAWDVMSAQAGRTRLEVEADRGLAPLVGRERELGLLEEAFERARAGRGQIVFVVGEPGIGKSRLLYEFRRRVADRAAWLEGHCLSFGQSMAFHPVIDLLKRELGIEERDTEPVVAGKIEAGVLRLGDDLGPISPYLRSLLSVDPGDSAVAAMTPELRRAETFEALRRLIGRAADRRPQIFLFEDLHWVDKTSEQFLLAVADAVPTLPVLFVLTYRPGYSHPFGERSYHTRIVPATLSAEDSARMAEGVLATHGLPGEITEIIVRKGEGNPFYVEEVVKSLRESGAVVVSASGSVLARDLDAIAVPDTIQDVIMARIDRLDEAPKKTLQLASVIGREFTRRLLDRLAEARERTGDFLSELKSVELIYEKPQVLEQAYTFRHALTQDVAYGSLLRERRRDLHRRIGLAIEELYAGRLAEHYDVLAHHFATAEAWDKALDYLLKSAEKAAKAFALREGLVLFEKALATARRLEGQIPVATIMAIHRARTDLFYAVGEYANSRLEAEALLELARRAGDRKTEAGALVQSAWATVWMEDFPGALELAGEAITLSEAVDEPRALAGALLVNSTVHSVTARHDQAEVDVTRALAVSRSAGASNWEGLSLSWFGFLRNWQGRYRESLEMSREGIRIARDKQQVASLLRSLWAQSIASAGLGEYEAALAALREGLALTEKMGNMGELTRFSNTLGWLHIDCGDLERGIAISTRSVELARSSQHATGFERAAFALINLGDAFMEKGDLTLASNVLGEAFHIVEHPPASRWMTWRYATHCLVSLGELSQARGDSAQAGRFADQCLEIAVPTKSRKYEARAWLLKGEIASARGQPDEAERAFRLALTVALEISEPRQTWRAYAALGRFHAERKDGDAAHRAYHAARQVAERVKSELRDPQLRAGLESSPAIREIYEGSGSEP
jgi:class 3 adenylate cyclase/tetratricopeptide (TPR) repeat protein